MTPPLGAQEAGPSPEKQAAIQKALDAGLSAAGPGKLIQWSPFVRLIREGSTAPIDVAACAKVVALAGAGKLKTLSDGRPFFANPHPYIGLQMTLASGQEEYIEAGLGYDANTPETGVFFRPYIRRAPDDVDVGGPQPPEDYEARTRNGVPLPGYWAAKREDLTRLMATDGEICMNFSLDPRTNLYHFDYTIKNPASGEEPFSKTLTMASVRKGLASGSAGARIVKFQARLLTSIAITGESFDPTDPVFKSSVFAVDWKASARDWARGTEFEPYSVRNFWVANYDPVGDFIFYRLGSLKP